MTEETIRTAENLLTQADPVLGIIIRNQKLAALEPRHDYFASLTRSIIGQQVSVAAARAIAGRFSEKTNMEPLKVVTLSDEEMREIGLSKQKMSYIRDLAGHFATNPTLYNHLSELSDEDVIADLTAIKGIGTWTAQMFLMFTLNRPDVFAPDDVGLQRAMMRLYGWEVLPAKKELLVRSERWRPYRTVASLHLWQSLDAKPS